MNHLILFALALLNLEPALAAEHKLTFPKAAPEFAIRFADTWRFIPDAGDALFAQSIAPQDEAVTVELRALGADQADKALAEAGKLLGSEFSGLQVAPPRRDAINALKVLIFKAAGENGDGGRTVIQCALFQLSGSRKYYMLTLSCAPAEESRHVGDLWSVLGSVRPLSGRSQNRNHQ